MPNSITYLSRTVAHQVDAQLMSIEHGFSLDQLMELAGLSVAMAIHQFFPPIRSSNLTSLKDEKKKKEVLVWCGPGNNGGDGLVAARHLFHFGYQPYLFYPKPGTHPLYSHLLKQLTQLDIPIFTHEQAVFEFSHLDASFKSALIVDALFGFSFNGQVRSPFDDIIKKINASAHPIISVDLPSGWDVEKGKSNDLSIKSPDMLVSLTAPKLGVQEYKGIHVVGGRFVPPTLAQKLNMVLPNYTGSEQIALLSEGPPSHVNRTSP